MVQNTSQLLLKRTDQMGATMLLAKITNDNLMARQVENVECSAMTLGIKFEFKKAVIDELKLVNGAKIRLKQCVDTQTDM